MKWAIKKIKEVAIVTAGQSPEGKFYNSDGEGMPFFQGKKEFNDKYIGEAKVWTTKIAKVAEIGDVLMSVRAPVGPINFATEQCCIGRGLASIRVKEKFDRDFLFLFFKNIENQLTGNAGAVFNSINKGQIENIEIPVPSLSEQQAIVEKLNAAFELIDRAKANIEENIQNGKELFQSKLNQVFSQKGDGWEERKLDEVTIIKGRIGYRGYTKEDLVNKGEGAITLSPSNIVNNRFHTNNCTYISWFKYEESPEIMVFDGDILFVKTGSTYGKVAVVENLSEKATINPQFVVLKNIKINNKFLFYSLTTKIFKEKVESIVGGTATPTLSQTNLGNLTIYHPNLETQQKIVAQLDELSAQTEQLQQKYAQKLSNLEELKKSILEKAFKGELTY